MPTEADPIIGNWYATKFRDAWEVAEYLAANRKRLEDGTRAFTRAVRESTVPASVKDAAMAEWQKALKIVNVQLETEPNDVANLEWKAALLAALGDIAEARRFAQDRPI